MQAPSLGPSPTVIFQIIVKPLNILRYYCEVSSSDLHPQFCDIITGVSDSEMMTMTIMTSKWTPTFKKPTPTL